MTFKPFLDVLPDEQRELWPALSDISDSFVLYGGTALALRLGHRSSAEAVKALSYFKEGDAKNVDAATQGFLSQQATAWDFTVTAIVKVADSLA